nr:hypothetical protein BaRGS_018768 [Batillaria attramentaria]
MVINHLEKLFVTNDAATILRELEVQHPAAKMLVMAAHQQEQECGDGTNFTLVFGGALMENAEELLRMGLSVTEVIDGYELALKKVQEILPSLVIGEVKDLKNNAEAKKAIRSAVMSKQYGYEDFLAGLITDACAPAVEMLSVQVPEWYKYYNVRHHQKSSEPSGSGLLQSEVIQGMMFKRQVEGNITKVEKAKIAVYSCPLDAMQTETKQIKGITEAGVNVIVTGGKVGDLAQHFCNKYKVMVVRLLSKWDLRRLCKSIGATPLPKITTPRAEECGHCDLVYVDEIGETPVVVFRQTKEENPIATIVIRGSTDNIMDDMERAVDDGVNTFKALTKSLPGLEQYAVKKFAESLEVIPRALAENTGVKIIMAKPAGGPKAKQNKDWDED